MKSNRALYIRPAAIISEEYSQHFPASLLSQCILDEIQVVPNLLEEGLEWIARHHFFPNHTEIIRSLFKINISEDSQKLFKAIGDKLVPILYSDEPYLHFAACWAFAWLGGTGTWTPEHKPSVLSRLLEIWRWSQLPDIQYTASWAIESLPIIDRDLNPLPKPNPELIKFIKEQYSLDDDKWTNRTKILASLVIAFYWRTPWTDEELAEFVASRVQERTETRLQDRT